MPYYKQVIDGHVVAKKLALTADANDGWIEIEGDPAEVEIYVNHSIPAYKSDTLIGWALQQVFAEALIPHMAAFLDFANKVTQTSYTNFMAYATAVGLTDTANTIVAKAIELGADIEVGG